MTIATIGQTLKDARDKKGLSYEEIHTKIKIHPRVLQLLEEGKFDKLPSPLFAKSFLRSYAEFLELNPAELIDAYEKEGSKTVAPEEKPLFILSVDEKQEASKATKNLIIVVAVVAGLIAGSVLLSYASKAASGWMKDMKQKSIKGATSTKNTNAKKGSTQVSVKPVSKPAVGKKEASQPKKDSEWVRNVDQGNFPKIASKAPLELRLRALDNVWTRVMADGKVLYQGILGRGAVETWTAKYTLELWTGNAANMFLSLNKYTLGSPGKGMIKKMIITHEGVKIPAPENR